ncbi:protein pxr1-like [Willisornis vidua]|uniref:Protein pxr1-like n=1 Tax=Willisornis vidua TaxID=1566151 RepID=A0ABQ9DBV8_9PASS|nr:protein pxr1-like [Willisornis vidua]
MKLTRRQQYDLVAKKANCLLGCVRQSPASWLRGDPSPLLSLAQLQQERRGARISENNNSADTKISEKGEGEGGPGAGVEMPLQPMVQTTVRQAASLQPEVHSGADIYLQLMEDSMPEQADA